MPALRCLLQAVIVELGVGDLMDGGGYRLHLAHALPQRDALGFGAEIAVHIRRQRLEHVEGAGNVDFQSRGDVLRLLFLLPPQLVIQVLQNRHILRHRVAEIIPVHHAHTAVDDGLFHRHEAVLAAHDQLAEGEDKVGFQAQRVFIVAVIEIQVHRVDVMRACGGDFNDLSVQALHQRPVFSFGVADDDVIVGDEEHVGDLPLCGKALATAGSA